MAIDTTHRDYAAAEDDWKLLRDVIAGARAVKKAGIAYLPRPTGRDDDEFAAYCDRAQFFDATSKTVQGMCGMIFRRPPLVALPSTLEYLLTDADGRGTPLDQLVKDCAEEVVGMGRAGLLVDYPAVEGELTLAEERMLGLSARLYLYTAENVTNWRFDRIGADYQLSMLVLREEYSVPLDGDEFAEEYRWQFRVLRLEKASPEDPEGALVVEVYRQDEGEWKVVEEHRPTLPGGEPMWYIPFVFVGSGNLTASIDKSPMLDIAQVNLGHYRNSADYEEALFMTGQPTPVVTGLDESFMQKHQGKLRIGSRAAWMLPLGATATLLGVDAKLDALAGALEAKESQMSALGARLLENRAGVEAAETARIRQSGEASVMGSIAANLTRAFELALGWAAEWMGAGGSELACKVNDEFFPIPLTPQQLQALVTSWQQGAITYDTLFENLVKGEVIEDGTDPEEYKTALEEEAANRLPEPGLDDENLEEEPEDEEEPGEDEEEPPEDEEEAASGSESA